MKKYWGGVKGQVIALLKRLFRDKTALFFTFLFPLIFLFIFGSIFGNQTSTFSVAIINHSQTKFARQFVDKIKSTKKESILRVKDVADMAEAKERLKQSELDGIIELSKDFGEIKGEGANARPGGTLTALYAKGSEQAGNTLSALVSQIADSINKAMGQAEPPITVASKALGDEALKTFDYTFTGLLAFSLMSMGVFGLANQMPAEKQRGSYRRLQAAPFTAGQLIIATAISYVFVTILSASLMVAVGILLFHFNMRGDWLLFSGFLVLSASLMTGLGLIVGAWAKNENQASLLSNTISFPMMFLSGAFFPSFLMPEWLSSISRFVPMTPIVDGFRLIMTEQAGLVGILPQLGMIVGWIIIVYFLAIKLFHWE